MTLLEQLQASLDNIAARKARGELTQLGAAVSHAAPPPAPQARVSGFPEELYAPGPVTDDLIWVDPVDRFLPDPARLALESKRQQYVVWDQLAGYARRFTKTSKARVRARRDAKRAAREHGRAQAASA